MPRFVPWIVKLQLLPFGWAVTLVMVGTAAVAACLLTLDLPTSGVVGETVVVDAELQLRCACGNRHLTAVADIERRSHDLARAVSESSNQFTAVCGIVGRVEIVARIEAAGICCIIVDNKGLIAVCVRIGPTGTDADQAAFVLDAQDIARREIKPFAATDDLRGGSIADPILICGIQSALDVLPRPLASLHSYVDRGRGIVNRENAARSVAARTAGRTGSDAKFDFAVQHIA